ncbi:MAG: chemotaxis response regulator protein-glutamate methylesterase [bacterium]
MLVVDDSSLARKMISRELSKDPSIEVIETAPDAYVARDLIVEKEPDVITLDIEMPKMDGLTFLKKIMNHNPLPVVVVSSLSQDGSDAAMEAVNSGAVDVVGKPGNEFGKEMKDLSVDLREKVKLAARVDITRYQRIFKQNEESANGSAVESTLSEVQTTEKMVAIGSSTGGVQALKQVIPRLPASSPGVMIAQHMPSGFTSSFASSLDDASNMQVKEAEDKDRLRPGQVLVAPGDYHMVLESRGSQKRARIKSGPRVNNQRPSCDVLFKSVAKEAGVNAVGVIMTGMGSDGVKGLRTMKEAGAHTIGQDEETSTVYGMPKEAYESGAVEQQVSLGGIPSAIMRKLKG